MYRELLSFLVILRLSVAFSYYTGVSLVINIDESGLNKSEIIYTRRFEAPPKSQSSFEIRGLDQAFLSYAVVQLHSFYFNVTFSLEGDQSQQQIGTHLGFILRPKNTTSILHMFNDNYDDVQCLMAVTAYNKSSPVVGGCNIEGDSPSLNLEQTEKFIIVQTPLPGSASKSSNHKSCGSGSTSVSTFFKYLPQHDFNPEVYFDGIKSLMHEGVFRSGHQAKQVYSSFKRYFEKSAGTGIVINSVVLDRKGRAAFYIPTVTYSCPENTWDTHCYDVDILTRAFSFLIVLFSVVMILNLLMPELSESFIVGMLLGAVFTLILTEGHHAAISKFDIFMTAVFGGLFIAAIFATISLFFRIGRYLTKLTFANLLMAIVMEIFFETYTSVYWQFGSAFVVSIGFHAIKISFSVMLGGLLLIMGLSHLLKVGNIHRVFINNLYALTSIYTFPPEYVDDSMWSLERENFINYHIQLNPLDYALILIYVIGAVVLTLRKEVYFHSNPDQVDGNDFFNSNKSVGEFNRGIARRRRDHCIVGIQGQRIKIVSRCRRHHYRSNVIHERSPLITHWLASDSDDDDVFVSPNTNLRYMRTLSSESKERIDQIQNFK